MAKVYLSIGTNLGDKDQNIINAIAEIGSKIGVVRKVSTFYTSEAWGYTSEHKYLNAAILVLTELSPLQILAKTQEIEKLLGREQKTTNKYSDRIIDIDILLYDKEILDSPELKIPHPKMLERDFVMIPLKEIAPDLKLNS
jgi:2-amino-4-hydroxy-6-hydroxymethyldihydropteridine diphosphokinase